MPKIMGIVFWILKGTLIAAVGLFFFTFVLLLRNTHLPKFPCQSNPAALSLPYEEVNFESTDGVKLSGWLIKKNPAGPTIIFCHGLGANKEDLLGLAPNFYKAGYNVFLFDFRGHGNSGGRHTSFGYLEQRDLEGAVDYLKKRTDLANQDYGIYGVSMGGAVGVLVAAERDKIKAIAVDSIYADLEESMIRHLRLMYGFPMDFLKPFVKVIYRIRFRTSLGNVSPIKVIGGISPRAILLINGALDERMLPQDAKRLYEAAGGFKELWLVPGARHLEGYGTAPAEYEKKVAEFFERFLK